MPHYLALPLLRVVVSRERLSALALILEIRYDPAVTIPINDKDPAQRQILRFLQINESDQRVANHFLAQILVANLFSDHSLGFLAKIN